MRTRHCLESNTDDLWKMRYKLMYVSYFHNESCLLESYASLVVTLQANGYYTRIQ